MKSSSHESASKKNEDQQQSDDQISTQRKKRRGDTVESIGEALSILNNAVQEEGTEMKKMILSDFENLKNILSNLTPDLLSSLTDAKGKVVDGLMDTRDRVVDYSKQTAENVDKRLHDRPWAFVGGALFSGLVLGHYLGRKVTK